MQPPSQSSVLAMLTRPSSEASIASRTAATSPSLSSSLSPPQPTSPLSPLSLASTASFRSSSTCSPASPSPASPSSPTSASPSIHHLFPSLAPSFVLHYERTAFTVHPFLLSHHSPFFHALLVASPSLSSYTVQAHPTVQPDHLLLLLQTLYSPPPPPASPTSAFTPGERALIASIQPLLLLCHVLQLPLLLQSLDALIDRCLSLHLKAKDAGLGFLLAVLAMGLEYGLDGLARRAEEEVLTGGWTGWWEGDEWKAMEADVRDDVRQLMVARAMDAERDGAQRKKREMARTW